MKGVTESKPKNISRHSWQKSLRLAAKRNTQYKRKTSLTIGG
jgi:hypothetical protein